MHDVCVCVCVYLCVCACVRVVECLTLMTLLESDFHVSWQRHYACLKEFLHLSGKQVVDLF